MFFKQIYAYFLSILNEDNTISKDNRRLHLLKIIRIGLYVAAAGITLILAMTLESQSRFGLYFLIISVFVLIAILMSLNKKIKVVKRLIEVKANWGKEIKKNRELEITRELFELMSEEEREKFYIDDRTWQDLDMDLVFQQIDRTQTFTGEQYLYYLLRKPEFSNTILTERNEQIETLNNDIELRESLQLVLNDMGRDGGEGMVSFIWGQLPSTRAVWIFRFLAFLSLVSINLTLYRPIYAIYTLLPMTFINMFFYYREKKKIFTHLGAFAYLGSFLTGVKRFTRLKTDNPEFTRIQEKLAQSLRAVEKISKQTLVFGLKNNEIAEYFFILFHTEAINFYKVLNRIKKKRDDLKNIYLTIGKLDAYLSIASYRAGLNYYSLPQLRDYQLDVEDLYHPLLKDPVSNSLVIEKNGALITGSNMSGKSTMLRAIGINTLLSQTIYTSLSRKYQGSFYKLLTSIGRTDNVISGDSYYMVEAKALLRIIKELDSRITILCIVDEIFRGTNSAERIAASTEVIRYLSSENCITFAATHDLELTEMLKDKLHNFHFKELVDDTGLYFDYHLWAGPATTRNAIRLLEYIGYPQPIIEGSRKTIRKLEAHSEKVTEHLTKTN